MFNETKNENTLTYIGQYQLLDLIIERAKQTKHIPELEKYVDMFVDVFVNTVEYEDKENK